MPTVNNWQLGREMDYPYDARVPAAAVRVRLQHQPLHRLPDLHDGLQVHLDLLQGPGAHVVEQRRDQALRRLPAILGREDPRDARGGQPRRPGLGRQAGRRPRRPYGTFDGKTIFEAAQRTLTPDSARVLGYLPTDEEWTSPNIYEDNPVGKTRRPQQARRDRRAAARAQDLVLLPRAHLQSLLLPGLPGRLSAQGDLQAARGRHRADRPGAVPRLSQVRRGLPLQEEHVPRQHAHEREVHRLLSRASKARTRRPAASRWRRAACPPASARSACRAS